MIIHADILQWAETYDGPPFHAALLDPPYGLNENEIDIQAVLVDWLADREHRPKGAGFMGREWDSFIPGPRIWRAIRERCYPGALLMAFGGTRTADLLGLALRLGGWEKVDELEWIYGSGFPKNHNISKAIDKAAKAERPVVGTRRHQPKFDAAGFEYRKKDNGYNSKGRESFDVTAAATDMARIWEGYGTAFKPAHEPILVFRNPFKGTYAANCTRTGAGALNVDGGRVGTDEDTSRRAVPVNGVAPFGHGSLMGGNGHPSGRWPSNLLLSHTPQCRPCGSRRVKGSSKTDRGVETNGIAGLSLAGSVDGSLNAVQSPGYADAEGYESVTAWQCHESCPVAALDRQSGERITGNSVTRSTSSFLAQHDGRGGTAYGDSGGASRFFQQSHWSYEIEERIASADPVRYCAKASKSEREAGLDPMQIKLLGMMEEIQENMTWESQDHDQSIRVGMDTPQVKDTTASDGTENLFSPMLCDGCRSMDQSQMDTKSTTETETSKTTRSKTSNSLTPSHTSGSTVDANLETASGGSPATCAMCLSPLMPSTGISTERDTRSMDAADHATSGQSSKTSKIDGFPSVVVDDGRKTPIDNPYLRGETTRRNSHPCIKPIALTRYLATLLLPPVEYAPRRILIPFAGAGSECAGAMLAGWEEVVGVELEQAHVAIANARMAFWRALRYRLLDPSADLSIDLDLAAPAQRSLFDELEAA